jgi:glutamate synthase (NADPH/NADH) small chain
MRAVQAKLLGAEEVTMFYRRGKDAVRSGWSRNGPDPWRQPAPVGRAEVLVQDGKVTGIRSYPAAGRQAAVRPEVFDVPADMVLKAIGQTYVSAHAGSAIAARRPHRHRCRRPHQRARVWAGGDCRAGGQDLTVEAVEHGKQAACHAPGADQRRGPGC